MASTIEVFLAGLALMINTILIFIMYFVNAAFLGPFVTAIDKLNTQIGGPLKIGEFTYIMPYVFIFLLISEVVLIIAFLVVIGRRTVYDDMQG